MTYDWASWAKEQVILKHLTYWEKTLFVVTQVSLGSLQAGSI